MKDSASEVTVIIHTRNSAATLVRLLKTTAWARERVVIDMESTDGTVALARQEGCRVLHTPVVPAVDGIRNRYLAEAGTEWILVLDSDEYLEMDAEAEVGRLIREHGSVVDAFALPRYNRIAGQVMRGSHWYPDQQIRLFRRGTVYWQEGNHRSPQISGGTGRLMKLKPPGCLHIHHDNYSSLAELLRRQLDYALNDTYSPDSADFCFAEYVGEAYRAYAARLDPEKDGDLSRALAHIMAWDRIVRGIIHWEKLGRRIPLDEVFSLPPYPRKAPGWWTRLFRKLGRLWT
jgi:glycosyltransferase involved in cell wall biosynthesis